MNRAELGRPTRTGPRAGSGFSRSVIESIGVELPERIVSTAEIQRGCERPIALRLDRLTGVRHRRVAGDGVFSIDLAKRAIARCLALSRYEPGDIDLLVCCNMSRYDGPGFHYTFEPNTSIRLRSHFGFESAIAFDVGNACAGMFTALKLVDALLRAEAIDVAMVVSGEYITHLTATAQKELADLDDPRLACLTLGDAGVALMVDRAADDRSGFHAIELYTAGRYSHLGIAKPTDRSHGGAIMLTNSLKLHKVAIRHSAENIARTLERVGWGRSDLDHVICHQTHEAAFYEAARQVNERVEDEFCHDDNMVRNVAERGNTASTTHFLAVWDGIHSGRIKSGDNVLFAVQASGLTIGTVPYTLDDLPERVLAAPGATHTNTASPARCAASRRDENPSGVASAINLPENSLEYLNLIQSAHGAASLAAGAVDAKVAIVGAGAAGLCAAHELMRVGLTPVIFEAQPRLGGRCHTYSFQGDPKAFAELGAMRIPFSQQSVFHYLEELGVKARQAAYLVEGEWPTFPSPKQVDTRFYFRGSNFAFVACDGAYIGDGQVIQRVSAIEAKFNALLARDLEALQELDRAYSGGNGLSAAKYQEYVGRRLALWSNVVDAYQDKSLFEVLKEYRGTMGSWSTDDIEMLGAIGLGTGGIGAIYNTAYLETLRESYHRDDRDMRTIVGGVSQITDALWSARRARAHGLGQASVAELNQGQFHRRVTAIRTPDDPRNAIEVTYAENGEAKSAHFPAVIVSCSLRGLEMGIEFNREAFADEVWYAIRNFGMVSSQKVFVRTKTPFWKRWNADNAGDPLKQIVTTISDTTTRQSYFLDARLFGEGRQTPAGVALLSYSWASNAVKFNALSDEQKVRIGLDNLAEIYGREITDRFEEEIEEVRSINWDLEEGFGDAFRQANAGQYEQHRVLFQQGLGQSGSDNGLYLAGEALAWYGLSGWIEGALHTGINAALATIGRLNRLPEATLSAVG